MRGQGFVRGQRLVGGGLHTRHRVGQDSSPQDE